MVSRVSRTPQLRLVRAAGLAALLAAALPLALPAPAFAQGGVNGTVMGNVFDQNGNPIRGVKVTVSSPTQIGGRKTTTTNDEGAFRFPGLQPGIFTIVAEAPGLQKYQQEGLDVGVTAPFEVTIIMEVATQEQEVKIVQKAPIIEKTKATVKTSFKEEFADNLPVEIKTAVENFVHNNTPGVVAGSDNVRSVRIRGGNQEQNQFLVEGFYMNGQKVTMKGLAAFDVQTAGYGAEYANAPGGVINMVTKSGSNRFEADISGFWEDSNLRFFKDSRDPTNYNWAYLINPAVSGPIIRDRLWYYINVEGRSEGFSRIQDPTGVIYPDKVPTQSYMNTRASLKLTWQIAPRHKLQSYSNFSRVWTKNNGNANDTARDAMFMTNDIDYFNGITWEAVLTDSLYFKSQVGHQRFWRTSFPERCRTEPQICLHIPQISFAGPPFYYYNNARQANQTVTEAIEFINSLEWFASHKLLGEHSVRLRSRFFHQLRDSATTTTGDVYVRRSGTSYASSVVYFSNDPRLDNEERYGWFIQGTRALTTVHSLSDTMRPTKYLTVTPAVAYTTETASNAGESTSRFNVASLTPSISAAWDATRDGRTVLRGSFSQYVDTSAFRLARFASGGQVTYECGYNASGGRFENDCFYSGGPSNRTFGTPCGPDGLNPDGTDCVEELKEPKTYEYTAGIEREIFPGIALGGDVVYRQFNTPYEQRETNRVWLGSGYDLDQTGSYRNGRNETVTDLGTPDEVYRRYIGFTAQINKREGALQANASYTWSKLYGTGSVDADNSEWGENPGRNVYLEGPLPDDRRHVVKSSVSYQVNPWFSVSPIFRYYTGAPYSRFYFNQITGGFNDYRARRGTDPGANINDPADDAPLRLPDRTEVNVQARANLEPLLGSKLEFSVDFINILALRTTRSVVTQDGPNFGQWTSRNNPTQLRLNFRYRF